ncbi:choice-of-anchor L domain-containing protein [Flavobacterium sp. SM2513]|uniref:choice-of-anchor L domain-containing protein n=1 Tax=Flavobacterium sp. SM2513 TaxID=3424766 RepID=UPI003D7FC1DE
MKRFLLLLLFLISSCFGFAQADIKVLNTNFQTKYVPGTEVVYTISVVNLGPAVATNINVSSLISNGISQKDWTGPVIAPSTMNANGSGEINHTIPTLASGQMLSYIMTIKVPLGFTGNLNCTVTATSATADPNAANNVVSDTDSRGTDADISVTNTNNQIVYTPGTTTTYIIKVKNNGPLNAGGVVVSNTIPAGITDYSWTGSNSSSGTNTPLNDNIGSLIVGKTITYTVTAQIPAGFVGNLTNTVSIASITTDGTPANNTATDTDVANSGADLVVVNTDGVGVTTYQTGTQKVYTVTVTNNGPSAAVNVVVNNAIPAGITSFSWTGSNGSSGTNVPLNNTIPSLASGATVTYTVTLDIPTSFTGNLTNEASATSDTVDLYPECPQCIDIDTLQSVADIMITNTNNQVTYIPGGTSIYTVTVTNNGTQAATNILVNNPIPAGITNFSWSGNGANGTNVNLSNTISNLAPGQSVVYTITMQIPSTLTGNLISIATANSAVLDNDTANNTATDTDTLGSGADIVVTNTNNQTYFTAGSNSVYTLTVTNNGPVDAVNVAVNNPIPAGVTTSSWTGDNGSSGTNVNLSNTIPLLTVGSSVVYTFTVLVPATQTTNFVSTATALSITPDPNPNCVACTDTDLPPVGLADIVTVISDGSAWYRAGQGQTYTITITNNGPSDAQNVVVQGNVSAGINASTISWSGNGNPDTPGYLNTTIPTLANGASVTYTVFVPVPANYSQTENLITSVIVTSDTTDPNPNCFTCTDVDTPNPNADIVVYKTNNQTQFLLSDDVVYVITVRNDGVSDAINVVVNDALPPGIAASNMTWISSTGSSGTGALTETIPVLEVGGIVIYKVTVRVPAFFSSMTGNLVNIVNVTSGTPEFNINNNNSSDVDAPRSDFVTVDSTTYTTTQLIKDVLINEPCVQLNNFSSSSAASFGYFHRNNSNFPFKEGIIIRSGTAAFTQGKYNGSNISTVGSNQADPDLNIINGNTGSRDRSFVKFDFVPTVDEFSFNFLFASQEYGTYQCTFADTFAFILTNLNDPTDVQNLAVVPGTSTPTSNGTRVSVVTVRNNAYNAGCFSVNAQYFGRFNETGTGPDAGPASSSINMRGQTVSMIASANVIPNTPYSIKLVIADHNDTAFDSAVFLEAGSFNIGGPKITGTGAQYAGSDDFSGSNAFCEGTPRVLQAGTAPNPNVTYSWKKDDVLIPGANSYQLEVNEGGTYTVIFSYGTNGCQQSDDIVVEFNPTAYPMEEAEDLYVCNDATPTFNLTLNAPIVMANYDQFEFDTYYYTSLEAAQDPVGVAIPSADITDFAGTNGQEIWMKMVNIFDGGFCDPIESFKLYLTTAPSGTFSYDEDGGEPGFCSGSIATINAVLLDLTVGGTYSAEPAGLTIDSDTGAIDLSTSLVGTYTVTYEYSVQGCGPIFPTTEVEIIFCGGTEASNNGPVCEGTPTFNLSTTDAGTGSTYEWKDYNGVAFSTDQYPVGVAVPTAAGSYIYSVVATINGVPTPASTTTLIVHPTPTASFVSSSTTICTNSSTTITFTGTAGATVNFTNGADNYSVLLDGTGNGEFITPNLPVDTTYTLVDVTGTTVPACSALLNDSITITVGVPTASIVQFTNAVICSGTATGLQIQGTPNAIVSYTKDGVTQPDATLSNAGTFTIDTGIQTVTATTTYTYALTNVVSNSTPPCSNAITGQTANLTVNALPTATITAVNPSVCEGTAATLNFAGTPNATITYSNGGVNLTTILNNAGTSVVTTALLSAATTFTLVSAEVTNTILCSNTLTGSVIITIDENPVITAQPTGATICINGTHTFTVVATGANLTYQWYKNGAGNPIATATNASYTVANATAASAGNYTVVVTGSCGTPVTSSAATLIITQETLIATQPQPSTTVCVGQPISLSVAATGTGLTYQWFLGTTSLIGETSTMLNIGSATTANAGTYSVVITNPCQTVTSANAVVIVNELPVIVTQPVGTTICEGQGISLSVSATGTGLTYQWFRNGTTIPSATSSTYTDATVTLAEAGNYTVRVYGVCTPAGVLSAIAVINVNQGVTFTQQPEANTIVCSGEPVSLSIATTGGTGVSYQWFKGSTAIAGATGTTYTMSSTVVADSGSYTCVVTVASCGTKTSNAAVVVVNQAPAITTQPQGKEICVGENVTFEVVATGTNLTYQWYKGTTAISGATTSNYTISNTVEADSGNYYCTIKSASCPDINTNVVALLVKPLPFATISQGNPSTICQGQSTQVIFNGTAGAVVIYTINGGTPETITLNANVPTILPTGILDETTVYELVSVTYTGANACSQNLTGSATVTVNPLPSVILEDGFICIDPVTLATTRIYRLDTELNEADFTFAWFDENGPIAGQTYSYYDVDTVGQYGVTITDIVTGCQSSAFANVDSSSPPTDFTYTVSGFFADNPTVVIIATPMGDYEYQLDYGPFQESNVFDNISAGQHTITVRDPQACDVLTKSVLIIDYPKYFTPNGDGINDTWNIPRINTISISKIYIFDRFGKLIKELSGSGAWDGTYNGQELPATDYWFTINYQESTINKEFRAHFSLKR